MHGPHMAFLILDALATVMIQGASMLMLVVFLRLPISGFFTEIFFAYPVFLFKNNSELSV